MHSFYSISHFFRMIDKKLAVIHSIKDINLRFRMERSQMTYLRLGNKSLFCSVPIMDIATRDTFKLRCVYRCITVKNSLAASERIYLPAFIKKDIEIMRMEKPSPESCPMIAGPDICTLEVFQWSDKPMGKWQQGSSIHYRIVYGDFIPLKNL